jgi:hypothetical protein
MKLIKVEKPDVYKVVNSHVFFGRCIVNLLSAGR